MDKVTALLVPENERMDFLPRHFGVKLMMRAETMVYTYLDKMCEAYNGGYWEYYTLSDGVGFYMAPRTSDRLRLSVEGNYFEGEMSADAAGIVATLFAVCDLAQTFEPMIEAYHALRRFASEHAEGDMIMSAID